MAVAGLIYPFVVIDRPRAGQIYDREITLVYQDIAKALLDIRQDILNHRSWIYNPWPSFLDIDPGKMTSFLIDHRIVTAVVRQDGRRTVATCNADNLRQVQFFRRLDPASTHQAIAQFVGGVLSNNPKLTPLGNDERLEKAGFDRKTSFRNRK